MPNMMPMVSASAKLCSASPPKNSIDSTMICVEPWVMRVRLMVRVMASSMMCGMVAQYNDANPPPGPNLAFVIGKRVRIEGMIVIDKPERFPEWRALAAPWVKEGSLKYRECAVDGLERAPDALAMVLRGENFGKMLVRVGADPA